MYISRYIRYIHCIVFNIPVTAQVQLVELGTVFKMLPAIEAGGERAVYTLCYLNCIIQLTIYYMFIFTHQWLLIFIKLI